MDTKYWHQRWETRNIGFHLNEANPLLVQYFKELNLLKDSRVFLPLCGKTRDISWLLAQGYQVVGAELNEVAITELFEELGVKPSIEKTESFKVYRTPGLVIWLGDIFNLNKDMLGSVEAIYDRAAFVALPPEMRQRYTRHLVDLTEGVPQLLICYKYDQNLMSGPPFSISAEEIREHYEQSYELTPLATVEVAGGLKGLYPAKEHVWLLKSI